MPRSGSHARAARVRIPPTFDTRGARVLTPGACRTTGASPGRRGVQGASPTARIARRDQKRDFRGTDSLALPPRGPATPPRAPRISALPTTPDLTLRRLEMFASVASLARRARHRLIPLHPVRLSSRGGTTSCSLPRFLSDVVGNWQMRETFHLFFCRLVQFFGAMSWPTFRNLDWRVDVEVRLAMSRRLLVPL